MEFKKRPEYFNFYLLENVSESSYAALRKKVFEKVREIEKIDEENEAYAKLLGMNADSLKTNVKFNFYISTYGGEVYDGFGICDMLHRLDMEDNGIDVTVICEGKIMSMGIPIILSVRNRVSTPTTQFMIHQVSGFEGGKLADMKESTDEMERLWKICKDIIVKNSKITMAQLDEWDAHRADTFFDAEKALEYGIIQEIIH